jgi:hypothetical protein
MAINSMSLEDRAKKLFPESPRLQEQWVKAVMNVRSTKVGWILDKQIVSVKKGSAQA